MSVNTKTVSDLTDKAELAKKFLENNNFRARVVLSHRRTDELKYKLRHFVESGVEISDSTEDAVKKGISYALNENNEFHKRCRNLYKGFKKYNTSPAV